MHDVIERRATSVVFASVMAVVLAALYYLGRVGFSNPLEPVALALGISLFQVNVPYRLARANSLWMSEPVLGIACVAVTMAAGIIAAATSSAAIALPFVLVGFAVALWNASGWIRKARALQTIAFLAFVVVFTVWCAGVMWGTRYKMPLFYEALSYDANIHHDTFYLSAIGHMFDTYGIPTTGLDGTPIIRYHFGSPWLFAKWSHLIGTDILTFYSLGYPIIVLPLFFYSLFVLGKGARRADWRVWLMLLGATAGFIPFRAMSAFAIWNTNAFISESQLIGIPLFVFLVCAATIWWRDEAKRSPLFPLVFVPLIIAADGFLKISLMLLLFALLLYFVWRTGLWKKPLILASVAVTVVAFGFTYRLISLPDQNGGISPLHFMRFDAAQGWQQFFPLFHMLWTWVYIAGRMWEERITTVGQLREGLKARKLFDVEALLLIAVLGFLPGEIVSIHGGSAVYFSDLQRWIAIALLMWRIPVWTEEWRARHPARERAGSVRLSRVLAVYVLAPFVITLLINLAQWPARALRGNRGTRAAVAQQGGVERFAYYPIVTELRELSQISTAEKKRSVLFIPQSNTQYWSMFTADGRCSWTPLIAPAISGIALIDGMPPASCDVTVQYNMPVYANRAAVQTASDRTDQVLCAKARAKGFGEVIYVDAPPVRPRRIGCYLPTS